MLITPKIFAMAQMAQYFEEGSTAVEMERIAF